MKKLLTLLFLTLSIPLWSQSTYKTLQLNGVDQYLDLGDTLNPEEGDLSFSIWFKTGNNTSNQMLVAKEGDSGSSFRCYTDSGVSGQQGALHFGFHVDATNFYDWRTDGINILDDEWHHLAWSTNRAANQPKVWIDGIEVSIVSENSQGSVATGMSSTSDSLTIGRRVFSSSPLYFSGSLTSIKVFDKNLVNFEAQELYNNGSPKVHVAYSSAIKNNCVLAIEGAEDLPTKISEAQFNSISNLKFRLKDGEFIDFSSLNQSITNSAVAVLDSSINGKSSFSFENGDFIETPQLLNDDNFTFLSVAKDQSEAITQTLYSQHTGAVSNGRLVIGQDVGAPGKLKYFYSNGTSHNNFSNSSVWNNDYNLFSITDNSGSSHANIMGGEDEVLAVTQSYSPLSTSGRFGQLQNGQDPFTGEMAEVLVFEPALDSNQRSIVENLLIARYFPLKDLSSSRNHATPTNSPTMTGEEIEFSDVVAEDLTWDWLSQRYYFQSNGNWQTLRNNVDSGVFTDQNIGNRRYAAYLWSGVYEEFYRLVSDVENAGDYSQLRVTLDVGNSNSYEEKVYIVGSWSPLTNVSSLSKLPILKEYDMPTTGTERIELDVPLPNGGNPGDTFYLGMILASDYHNIDPSSGGFASPTYQVANLINVQGLTGTFNTEKNKTVNFNGSDQVLSIPDNQVFKNKSALTISVWVNPSELSHAGLIECATGGTGGEAGLLIENNSGDIRFQIANKAFYIPGVLGINRWYHLVGVYEAENFMKLYVDGVLVDETTENIPASTGNVGGHAWIAARDAAGHNPGAFYNGSLSNLNIYNASGSDLNVTELYNSGIPKQPWQYSQALRDAVVLALPLNDGVASGREFEDFSGNENDVTLVNSPSLTGSDIQIEKSEKVNASKFDGSTSHLEMGGDTGLSLPLDKKFTFSFWINSTNADTDQAIISKFNTETGDQDFIISKTNANKLQLFAQTDSNGQLLLIESTSDIELNKWIHFLVTSDGNVCSLYRDGHFENSATLSGNPKQTTALFRIGSRSNSSATNKFFGQISTFLYTHSHSKETDVELLYNQNIPCAA